MLRSLTLFVLLALFAPLTLAAEATSTLSWTAPTERVDGTPLAASEIAEYRAFYSVDEQPTTTSEFVVVAGDVTEQKVTLTLTPRKTPYVISFAVIVVDTAGRQSALSATVSKTFNVNSTAEPNAPTTLQFTIVCGEGCTIQEVTTPVE